MELKDILELERKNAPDAFSQYRETERRINDISNAVVIYHRLCIAPLLMAMVSQEADDG